MRSTIWSYGYHGPLSFRSNLADVDAFQLVNQESLADFNIGTFALSDHPCNVDFLEHEKWLLCMLSEVGTLPEYEVDSLEARSSELRQVIRNELSRLQSHKEVEWRRQKVVAKRCERAGVPFFDSGESLMI